MKRPYRVIVAKPGLDGHDRGAKVIARALRDAGFEVIYTGLHQTPEQVVQVAVQEDADAVGLSLSVRGPPDPRPPGPRRPLRAEGLGDVLVIVGGIIPDADIPALKELGVAAVFTPGAPLPTIVQEVADALDQREEARPGGENRTGPPRSPPRDRATHLRPCPSGGPPRQHRGPHTLATETREGAVGGSLRVPG
jgi:methylmalonyl-CoA mutase C-terminal domain/subunit